MPHAQVPARIGISSCLLGEKVRWDGGHKRDAFLLDTLGRFVEWVAVCPEVEMGLGVPRDTLHLERRGRDLRLITTSTGTDHTDAMRAWARERLRALQRANLSGYVLKERSPSCGLRDVRVHVAGTRSPKTGRGTFAEALLERFPLLPIEEAARLADPRLRAGFIERVFAYRRLRSFFAGRWSRSGLAAFHAAHSLQLMAHDPAGCARLDRLVARARTLPRPTLRARYATGFMLALATPATFRSPEASSL